MNKFAYQLDEVILSPYKIDGCHGWFAILHVGYDQYDVNPCDRLEDIIKEGEALAVELGVKITLVS